MVHTGDVIVVCRARHPPGGALDVIPRDATDDGTDGRTEDDLKVVKRDDDDDDDATGASRIAKRECGWVLESAKWWWWWWWSTRDVRDDAGASDAWKRR